MDKDAREKAAAAAKEKGPPSSRGDKNKPAIQKNYTTHGRWRKITGTIYGSGSGGDWEKYPYPTHRSKHSPPAKGCAIISSQPWVLTIKTPFGLQPTPESQSLTHGPLPPKTIILPTTTAAYSSTGPKTFPSKREAPNSTIIVAAPPMKTVRFKYQVGIRFDSTLTSAACCMFQIILRLS